MKSKLFTVYDRAIDAHSVLFVAPTEAMAVRNIAAMRKNPSNPMNEYSHEMDLYEVGEFNDATGSVSAGSLRKVGSLKSLELTNAQS